MYECDMEVVKDSVCGLYWCAEQCNIVNRNESQTIPL